MKKLLVLGLALVLVLAFGISAMADNTVKIGGELSGQLSIPDLSSNASNVNTGYSVGYEYTVPQGQLEYGGGLEYQLQRAIQGGTNDGQQFNFIPVYGVIRYNFNDNKDMQPYATARLGYDFMYGDSTITSIGTLNGGLYYAAGFGMNFKQYTGEVLYNVNQGSMTPTGLTASNLTYSSWAVRFGYKF